MWYASDQEYIGATADLKRRLPEHNAGRSTLPDKYKALACEKYLKSHSGRASAKKRF